MTMEEISECEFIKDTMKFYSYEDFIEDAKSIKRLYITLKYKTMYKWFVYANCYCSQTQKDVIWCYLNGEDTMDLRKYSKKGKEYERYGNRNIKWNAFKRT